MTRNSKAVALEGNFVRLEPLTERHLEGLCAIGLDPDLWVLSPQPVASRGDMEAYIRTALEGETQGTTAPFATVDTAGGRVVGSTRFGNIDLDNRRVEIGWTWIAKPWQRTAINTEAKLLMLRHAFEYWGCNRVEFKTDARNERSRSAILRLGAEEEGTLRQHMVTSAGRLRDTVYFSIIRDEWPGVERRLCEMLVRRES